MRNSVYPYLAALVLLLVTSIEAAPQATGGRKVAITFDDLPAQTRVSSSATMATPTLLHANRLISLDEALKDPVFERADRYTGTAGITWLHRWALSEGKNGSFFGTEPEPPTFVIEESGLDL